MKRKQKRKEVPTADRVALVGDGMLAGPVLDGKAVPVLIIDTHGRPQLDALIQAQAHLPEGDVTVQWGGPKGDRDTVYLHLQFVRPVEVGVLIPFSIQRQGILVEAALTASAVYLRTGVSGDRISQNLDRPTLLVGLPDTGFRQVWDELLLAEMTEHFAERMGISRRQAKPHAQTMINETKKLTGFRMTQR